MQIRGVIFNVGSETIKYSFFKGKQIMERKKIYARPNKKIINNILDEAELKLGKIDIVAHRVVHGYGLKSCFVNKNVINKIKKASPLAILHNPYQLKVIEIIKEKWSKLKQFVAFDTDAFTELPLISKTYALPLSVVEKYKIYRYGFHGLNIEYINSLLKREIGKKFNAIIFHLGAGCSVTAIKNGKPIETSMGFTPLEGCIMVNRAGNIDAGIVLFLCKKLGIKKTEKNLHNAGILALTGIKDIRKVIELRNKSKRYGFAFEMFCYRASQIAASYMINFDNIDAFVFTGGIGENSWQVRERIMSWLKIKIDKKKNKKNEKYIRNKKPYILVIKANEEKTILDKLFSMIK